MLSAEDYFLRYVSILRLKRISQGRFLEKILAHSGYTAPIYHFPSLPEKTYKGKIKMKKTKKTCK